MGLRAGPAIAAAFLMTGTILLAGTSTSAAQERIHHFHSRIQVHADGSLSVEETIRVTAAGQEIRRGIYRDFPTLCPGPLGTRIEVPFQILEVGRDGQPDAWHTERLSNGVRVYVGSADRLLEPREYTYTLRYRTDRQLGFFPGHDELYWNVTGNKWAFPIDGATAEIRLPPGVPPGRITHEGYTGPAGSRAADLESTVDPASGAVLLGTTRGLQPGEGLTVVAGWPKGFVQEPTPEEHRAVLLTSNRALVYGLAVLLGVLVYYLIACGKVGRDPKRGTVIPRYEPPLEFSPSAVHFVDRMGYDDRCFAAAVIDMAVKGVVALEENDGTFTLRRLTPDYDRLARAERQVAGHLLGPAPVRLEQTNHQKISKAVKALRTFLNLEYEGKLFYKNRRWLVPGLAVSVGGVLAATILGATAPEVAAFIAVWLSLWTVALLFLLGQLARKWREVWRGRDLAGGAGPLGMSLFALPFLAGEIFGLWVLAEATSMWMIPILRALVGVNFAFFEWLKRPTLGGQEVRDEIRGFRMYLATAEGDVLRHAGAPPARTPELFERYLPYALALDLEARWAEQFSDVLARAAMASGDGAYRPAWYRSDRSWSEFSPGRFAAGTGSSLTGAIASSARAPGSSSGAGGGGSSGGGGGGGGGW